MENKYELPVWVLAYKKKGQCIKVKAGKYYLYQTKNVYKKQKKHGVKKDIYLGRITEFNGFIKRRPTLKESEKYEPQNIVTKNYGGYALITKVGDGILENLKKVFPDDAHEIFIIAALKCLDIANFYDIEDLYEQSYFSVFDNSLNVSKASLSDFVAKIGKNRDKLVTYMKHDVEKSDTIIFDGTNIFCGSNNITSVNSGYQHGHNYKTQINILYGYSLKTKGPTLYKNFDGSVGDSATLTDVISEFGLEECTFLVDNGFQSKENLNMIELTKSKYLMTLKSNSKHITQEILDNQSRSNAKEYFTNHGETVYAYEVEGDSEERVAIFFNQAIASTESTAYLDRIRKNYAGFTNENFMEEKKKMGLYVIQTNQNDWSLQKIYETYKTRFEIEYMFDTIKNTFENDRTYMHSDASLEGWTFINHISISLMYEVYELLKKNDALKYCSPSHLFKKLRGIKMQRSVIDSTETYNLQVVPKKTRTLCETLDIML